MKQIPPLPDLSRFPIAQAERSRIAVRRPRLPNELPTAPNVQLIPKEYAFTGSWTIIDEPLVIGDQNYSLMQNLRYGPKSLLTVNGYSKITPAAHATYIVTRSGIQLLKPIDGALTSFVLVQAKAADLLSSAILLNLAVVPAQGNFQASPLWTESTPFNLGRFSLAPDANIVFCNENEALIWGSPEHRIAAFLVRNGAGTFNRDYTETVQDNRSGADSEASIHIDGSTVPNVYFGSTRKLQAIKLYVVTPNTEAVTIEKVQYWGPSGWADASSVVDGTLLAGETLGQTGILQFATGGAEIVKVEEGYALYFYRFFTTGATSAGTSVRYVTVDAPMQPIRDVWDGIYRTAVKFMVRRGGWNDFTLQAAEEDDSEAVIGNVDTGAGDYVLVGFTARQQALRVKVKSKNSMSATMTAKYWNGSGWVTLGNLVDGTADGGQSLGQTGIISWTPPDPWLEHAQTLFGETLFYYQLTWSATLTTTTGVDLVQGIPSSKPMHGYRFAFKFQSRLMLAADILGNQRNKVDFSAPNAPDVWNGEDTSDQGRALFFGDNSGKGLMAATEIYNRFAGALAYLALVCTANETYLLSGNDPGSFAIFPMSQNIGCPAPLTMTSVEMGYSVAEDAQRNVALWLSHTGPVLCDASVLKPIAGLEPYFDPNDSRYINRQSLETARAWLDADNQEWNLTFANGVSTSNNIHVVFDLRRERWYPKVPETYLGGAFPVHDSFGNRYVYGLLDTGLMLRLEHGFTWDGEPMVAVVETGEISPSNSVWEITLLRYLKILARRKTGAAANLTVTHYLDGSASGSTVLTLPLGTGANSYVDLVDGANRQGDTHRLRFSVSTSDAIVKLLGWACVFQPVRQDRP